MVSFSEILKIKNYGKKLFCTLELYYNLTPAEQICHLLGNARTYWRKGNSYSNWSKRIIFTLLKRRRIACWDKHRDFWKVKNTLNGDQLDLIEKIQHAFRCITSTKSNGWKCSTFIPQNLPRTTNPENFSSIDKSFLKYLFSKAKITRFERTSFNGLQKHKVSKLNFNILRFKYREKHNLEFSVSEF